ncbi:hypothetical protein COCNU_scaffold003089G000030 [Cocos nucifera]|nr:hypothetical protein [Cocos nucifera]
MVNTPSSTALADATTATKVTLAARVGAVIEGSMPPSSIIPLAEDPTPRPLDGREEGKKKKKKRIIVKVHHKAHPGRSSDDGDNPREDSFGSPKLIQDLTDRFAMLEVVDQMANLDHT